MMPLFIDRLPFRRWLDATKAPPLEYWSIVLPILLTEPQLPAPPANAWLWEWVLDTACRSEGLAWKHHLLQAGLDPRQRQFRTAAVRTVAGQVLLPVREADLWLVSTVSGLSATPYRIELLRGLTFQDSPQLPDPEFQRPILGLRAMRTAGLRVEIDFANDTVSVWTPDPAGSSNP